MSVGGSFQLSLILKKIKNCQTFWTCISETTHPKVSCGKIKWNLIFWFCPAILDPYWHSLLRYVIAFCSIFPFFPIRYEIASRSIRAKFSIAFWLIVAPWKFDVLKTNIFREKWNFSSEYTIFKNNKFPRGNYQTHSSET